MANVSVHGGVDGVVNAARTEFDRALRTVTGGALPDPRFAVEPAVDDDDNRRTDRRTRQTLDATEQMTGQTRNANSRGTQSVGAVGDTTSSPTPSRGSTVPTALLSGSQSAAVPTSGTPYVPQPASTLASAVQPLLSGMSSMVQPLAAASTQMVQAPAGYTMNYSSAPGDRIVLTPEQQQRLAAALAAASEGGSESTTIDGQDLATNAQGPGEQKALQIAKAVVDAKVPYAWGGGSLTGMTFGINGPGLGANDSQVRGMDCSGFTRYVNYQAYGVEIPRTSGAQYAASHPVSAAEARPGDLVFQPGNQANHVQLYIGDGKIAEEYQSGTTARITEMPAGSEIRRPNGT